MRYAESEETPGASRVWQENGRGISGISGISAPESAVQRGGGRAARCGSRAGEMPE